MWQLPAARASTTAWGLRLGTCIAWRDGRPHRWAAGCSRLGGFAAGRNVVWRIPPPLSAHSRVWERGPHVRAGHPKACRRHQRGGMRACAPSQSGLQARAYGGERRRAGRGCGTNGIESRPPAPRARRAAFGPRRPRAGHGVSVVHMFRVCVCGFGERQGGGGGAQRPRQQRWHRREPRGGKQRGAGGISAPYAVERRETTEVGHAEGSDDAVSGKDANWDGGGTSLTRGRGQPPAGGDGGGGSSPTGRGRASPNRRADGKNLVRGGHQSGRP